MPSIKGVKSIGDSSITLGKDKMISSYSLEFLVFAHNLSQGPIAIRETVGLPKVGLSVYAFGGEGDATAVCKRKTPRQDTKQKLVWYVQCDFDNDPSSQSQEDEDNQPGALARPVKLEWDSEYGERVLHRDFSTPPKPIVSSNLQPFDPPLTTEIVYPVLIATRFQATFSVGTKLAYENHCNSDAWNGAAAYQVLCTSIRAVQVVEDATTLWQVTYRFRYCPLTEGYLSLPANVGSYKLVPRSGQRPRKENFITNETPYVAHLSANGQAEVDFDHATFGGPSSWIDDSGDEHTVQPGFKRFPQADFDGLSLF